MKRRQYRKVFNRYKKEFKNLLKNENIEMTWVSDKKRYGFFETDMFNNKHLGISIDYAATMPLKQLHATIRHELTHVIDFITNKGWRLCSDGEILYHDEVFWNLNKNVENFCKNGFKKEIKCLKKIKK